MVCSDQHLAVCAAHRPAGRDRGAVGRVNAHGQCRQPCQHQPQVWRNSTTCLLLPCPLLASNALITTCTWTSYMVYARTPSASGLTDVTYRVDGWLGLLILVTYASLTACVLQLCIPGRHLPAAAGAAGKHGGAHGGDCAQAGAAARRRRDAALLHQPGGTPGGGRLRPLHLRAQVCTPTTRCLPVPQAAVGHMHCHPGC